ncbi:MAG: hypothetical protein M0R75_01465 [Dehalococcoidia bacterium]|nr:hypothetical protein [Dehalococcoidia bacterium]
MHVNRRIREAIRERLEEADVFADVYTNRPGALSAARLPAAVIATSTDEVALQDKDDPPSERREIEVTVTIVGDGESESVDDDMDELRSLVEEKLAGDLDGLAWYMEHTGGALEMASDEEGDRWFAFYVLSWRVLMWTTQGNPEPE